MLVLERKAGQTLVIGPENAPIAVVKVCGVREGKHVIVGVEAPRHVKVLRGEIVEPAKTTEKNAHA